MVSYFIMTLAIHAPLEDQHEVGPMPRMLGEFVELKTESGTLYGIIDLPSTPGPWPIVLIHPGSGPTDRDGNSRFSATQVVKNDSLKMLGRALAGRGIAALRIDKRGIAESAKAMAKAEDLRVETYGDDAAAWIAQLRKDRRFTKVGIIGHSEGSLIALLASKKEKVDALVSLCGLARPIQDVLRAQLKPELPKDLYEAADKIMIELAAGREVPEKDIPSKILVLFHPKLQPYLISEFKQDPAAIAAKLDVPMLVISGTTDVQVTLEDGKRLAGAKPGIEHRVIENMNHVLKQIQSAKLADQLSSYTDPTIPMHPKVVDEIAVFLKQSLGK
jgi:pimeloyl-ACP methyl ester carboxylesterase